LTRVLTMSEASIGEAARAVRQGKIIAFPTDTVYGLGCDPFNTGAVQKLVAVKKRTRALLPILVSSHERAKQIGSFNNEAERLARAFWPGALTLVVPTTVNLSVELTGPENTIGLRVPGRIDTRNLIERCDGAIVGTSANVSGNPALTSARDVEKELGGTVDLILDGGKANLGMESTVVKVDADGVHVLREGAISREKVFATMGSFAW
jgi:L-threonylcarbamoyladenylate synthase